MHELASYQLTEEEAASVNFGLKKVGTPD